MRVLILSCNTGEGHNSCAKAIKEVFDKTCDVCTTEDALRFISDKTSHFISWGHTYMYRHIPSLFNWGYDFTENHTGVFKEKNMLYHFFGKGTEELYRCIAAGNYDTVICVHPFAALMLTEVMRRYQPPIKTAFVATDYTCSPSVKDSELDYYFIPSHLLARDFACEHITADHVIASGIPIRQAFYAQGDKEKAKRIFGIKPQNKHVVMMCGSMGCGPMEELVDGLSGQTDGLEVTVICGTNHKLKTQLESKYNGRPNLHIRGFVRDMSTMLDSADLYLTKAGGISVTEALTKKVPMVFINAVAGCEAYNSDFFVALGCAVKSESVQELVGICTSLIRDEERYNDMMAAFDSVPIQNAAECMYRTLCGETK